MLHLQFHLLTYFYRKEFLIRVAFWHLQRVSILLHRIKNRLCEIFLFLFAELLVLLLQFLPNLRGFPLLPFRIWIKILFKSYILILEFDLHFLFSYRSLLLLIYFSIIVLLFFFSFLLGFFSFNSSYLLICLPIFLFFIIILWICNFFRFFFLYFLLGIFFLLFFSSFFLILFLLDFCDSNFFRLSD